MEHKAKKRKDIYKCEDLTGINMGKSNEKKKKNIYKPKIINGLLIEEKNITVVDDYYLYNVPLKISYECKEFYLPRKAHLIDGKEFTWWCQNARKIDKQNEKNTKFCPAKIIGIRNNLEINKFNFYLIKNHADNCINIYPKKIKDSEIKKI